MENLTKQEIDYSFAKERVQKLKKFYTSLAIFIIIFAAYSMRRYYLSGDIIFMDKRNISVIFWIWGIILAIKSAKLFFFNGNWERKMMDKELKQTNYGKF
ncbi:2TM domain-containing protein [Frigoriflavimonas asaccharolytica]|uniref:2TM domain-containing protein n=1 Tax=Frigoriflavimonas asaccharolytica TaxID=2735899 RepID=A0A8J8GCU0_9FLAO|nr:2TM domain-containing protein [Frigoriflavimonas asaccharolytica]NRS93382.1 hypothetical protein [Frigoriflavimonas asaccharolytica]